MKTLKSYVCGEWHEAEADFVVLVNPSTEEEIARASSTGVDFSAVLHHAREFGGPALRAMTFAERGGLLKAMSKALRDHRDELLDLSRLNSGATRGDGSFDIDGATGTLAFYAGLGKTLGDRRVLPEGEGIQLARTEGFWAQHVLIPRKGAAVHINAFNFPAWGFAEKAACAFLAGMPVITKPATATALVTERCVEILVEADILPQGALQLICGGTGDLLDRLGVQDVFAFTGSADTAHKLRQRENLLRSNTRINIEADSLNAAVLGPDVKPGSDTFELFVRDVVREMTQKSGQKCTAVRRILVPTLRAADVHHALAEKLDQVVLGDPKDASVTMGPLSTAQQLADAEKGVAELATHAQIIYGTGKRADGVGAPAGKGYFFPPVLLRVNEASAGGPVHSREVFGPVATLVLHEGDAHNAAAVAGFGDGTLVTSVYSDDPEWLSQFLMAGGSGTGRLYVGSEGSARDAFGSGAALPQTLHGGPGRAGGGEELGGENGLRLYQQRVALQGSREMVDFLAGITAV